MTPTMPAFGSWRISTRLFAAQAVVALAIVASAGLVASLVGPPLFHAHLLQSGQAEESPDLAHIEQAFASASMISLSVGLLVAMVGALVISWTLARRIGLPLDSLTRAATRLSHGDYSARAAVRERGPEFTTLGEAFDLMADRLENTEATRRRLLSDLAHEMRTPIATLSAHLEAEADGVLEWNAQARGIVEQQAERLRRLVRDLDEVSRAEECRMALDTGPHFIAELVDASLAQARQPFAEKGVHLSRSVEPAQVEADPARIGQVLTNLLNNALRHTPAGGSVSVVAVPVGEQVRITVADDGAGITPEQLPHVFERFYRGDSARASDAGGSGIGLTIARAIADGHGGSLTATSPGPGQGSVFTLLLPQSGSPRVADS